MTLDLLVVILAVVNIVFAILNRNWVALMGWFVGGLGFLKCYLMG